MPDWAMSLADSDSSDSNGKAEPLPERIPKGQRHSKLLSLAGSLRNRGATRDEIRDALHVINKRCDPTLTDDEIDRLAADVAERYQPGNVPMQIQNGQGTLVIEALTVPDDSVDPFPTEVLPDPLKKFVEETASMLPCPVDFVAVPMLTALGAAVGTRRIVEMKSDWQESARIWAACVGRTGTHKSPALEKAIYPLTQKQQWLKKEHEHAEQEYLEDLERYETDKDNRSGKPIEPRMKQAITTDATLEALAELLERNPRGLAFVRDELVGWVTGMDQYRAGKGADRQAWLSLWNGAQVTINRKNRSQPIVLVNPFVCVMGCLPPDVIADLTDTKGREDGFVDRILFTYPDEVPVRWTDAAVSEATVEEYGHVFNALWDLPETPLVMPLTTGARDVYGRWYDLHHAEIEKSPENLRGPFSKLDGYCARLALVLQLARHVCGDGSGDHVDEVSMAGAIKIVMYFKSHLARVHNRVYASEDDRRMLKAVEWIRKRGSKATARDILTGRIAGCKNRKDVENLFQELTVRGHGHINDDTDRKDTLLFVLET